MTRNMVPKTYITRIFDAYHRQLLDSANFKKVYQITPEAKDRVAMSVYRDAVLGFAPTFAYLLYFATSLPFSLFYLSGFIITERMGMMMMRKIISDHKRTVESIEISEEYNMIRFKLLEVPMFTSIVHTENALFNNKNSFTFTFNKNHVRSYNNLYLDNFVLPSGAKDKKNVISFIGNDLQAVNDLIVDLNCNALDHYNEYLRGLEAQNGNGGELAERMELLRSQVYEMVDKKKGEQKEVC